MRTRRAPLRWTFVNHDPALAPDLLHEYVDGWRRRDIPAVLTTLADDCVIVEPDGTVHRGRDEIGDWMRQTVAQLHDWQIISSAATGDLLVAEWERWQGSTPWVAGVTIARPAAGRIGHLRDYVTSPGRAG